MDGNVRTLGIFDIPFIGRCIAAIYERQIIPLEDEAHRSIDRVDGREALDDNTVFLEDDLVVRKVGKLVNLKLAAPEIDDARTRRDIPEVHLLHMFHRVLGAVFWCVPTWAPDAQWRQAIHRCPT